MGGAKVSKVGGAKAICGKRPGLLLQCGGLMRFLFSCTFCEFHRVCLFFLNLVVFHGNYTDIVS